MPKQRLSDDGGKALEVFLGQARISHGSTPRSSMRALVAEIAQELVDDATYLIGGQNRRIDTRAPRRRRC
jgi:hypothetical protein